MKRTIGTSGFSYAAWKGKFYPKKFPADQMLAFYSERFPAVEINSTFYRLPIASTLKEWAGQVPENFVFAFKAPGSITHRKWSAATDDIVDQFLSVTAELDDRAGPLLFQFPPFQKKDMAILDALLSKLPRSRLVAFEFRHISWFENDVYDRLKKQGAALVFNDADMEAMPFVSTAPWGYLRLRRLVYTDKELQAILKQCAAKKWKEVFIFFKHEDTATGPALALRLQSLGT